ncbi:unnamed protein product [Parnassius apollo]|uniref:Fatty acyl-CoA reductase n=1 Tax=Parnassius apollo TaxID=110799 RepID=A0A8S3X3A1_PARAO|nr:unnamed protein product [Parnassius apollo]
MLKYGSSNESVADFYAGKSVFVTGGTGYLGKVLIEKLLYSCEKLDKIYLLIREKKNVSPEKRLQHIFEQPIFKRLKCKGADYMQKVVPIVGDISEPNLAVTEEDEKELREKVSIVFHMAATVKFNEPLKVAMNINFEGTRRVLNLCKKMKQLQTFVYVSTAYTNTNREIIEEVIYPPPASYEEVYTALQQYGDNDKDIRKLLCDRPNTYTFTKALAEHYVAEQQNKIPTVIIRPSIVAPSINEPLEGWVDNWFGATSLMVMIGKGHYRVVAGASSNLIDLIPVDYVSNVSIAAAAKCEGYDGLLVYNCCTSGANPVTYGAVCRCFIEESVRFKLNDIPYPTINFTKHQWLLKTIIFIMQMIPAFFADCFLWLSGKRPRYVKLQRKVLRMNNTQQYFTSRSWVMDSKETQALYASLSDLDKNMFPFNPVSIVWSEYLPVYYKGVKTYLF